MTSDRDPYMEVREYTHTIHMFFDGNGNVLGEEDQNDNMLNDIIETRPMTEDEREDWLSDDQ